jgi:hypothetical protein
MLSRVARVRTNGSEEDIASIIKVKRIGELGTSAVTSNRSSLAGINAICNTFLHSVLRWLAIAKVPSSPILSS